MTPHLLIVGSNSPHALESAYERAFHQLGWSVSYWDPAAVLQKVARGGRVGRFMVDFLTVDPWIRKVNREFVLKAIEEKPTLILTFTHRQIRAGALAQIRAAVDTALVNIWPDTLVNWGTHHTANLPMYDLVATYSQQSVAQLQRLGASNVAWIPLAGDPDYHRPAAACTPEEAKQLGADITFIGGWRPEREAVLTQLAQSSRYTVKIWGPEWGRRCKGNEIITSAWQGRPLFGHELATSVANSRINLNIIDPTNYPAANMRFFELAVIGGLQVCSPCPEMEDTFRHGEHVLYYRDTAELEAVVSSLLADENHRQQVASAGQRLCLAAHTYTHRASAILQRSLPRLAPASTLLPVDITTQV